MITDANAVHHEAAPWHRSLARCLLTALLALALAATLAASDDADAMETLLDIYRRAAELRHEEHSSTEYQSVAKQLRLLQQELAEIDPGELDLDQRLDHRLLASQLEIRRFELEDVQLWRHVPVRYLQLHQTDGLLLRPCAAGSEAVAAAIEELERLPTILANAERNLTDVARVWTENALATASYANLLLDVELPQACIETKNRPELLAAAKQALAAIRSFVQWLEHDLLPRSHRSPSWDPAWIETYHRVQEWLPQPAVADLLRVAVEEERLVLSAMQALATRIHPTGDLRAVWELMKDEAPPWDEVLPMAQRYVEMTAQWLAHDGSHLLTIPEHFDYGTVVSTPMARRVLSFGGASYGPTLAGRISGYYVITPLEESLTATEKASRLRSYNPYWTHVISYHEWVGHNVQRAWAIEGERLAQPSAIRRSANSAYLSQAWSFYLEKLFEDHGYFESTLPHMEALKTRMARLQMRMWRVQRILTKLRMARGEMTFDEAVQAYVERIGMEPTNAFIEVQRDSQSPASPGREIIGERLILDLWQDYQQRLGAHARLKDFHRALLLHGTLPLPAIRQLLLRDEDSSSSQMLRRP